MAEPDGLVLYECAYKNIDFQAPTESNKFFINTLICALFEKQLLKMRLVEAMARNYREKVIKNSEFVFKKIKKVKRKKRVKIEEAYKNHLKNKGKFKIRYAKKKKNNVDKSNGGSENRKLNCEDEKRLNNDKKIS